MKSNGNRGWLCGLLLLLLLTGCSYPGPDYSAWDLSEEAGDSLRFAETHHYSVNYNFVVYADSLGIVSFPGNEDSLYLRRGDLIVVADYAVFPTDSIDSVYVKVAHDQPTIGWLRERDLLGHVTPDDPISRFIYSFSGVPAYLFGSVVVGLVLMCLYGFRRWGWVSFVHVNDIGTPYPSLLCLLVAGAAVFYGSICHFVPSTWVHYYYHPTLNPFALPFGMGCFVGCVWGIVLMFLAVLDEVFHSLSFSAALGYLCSLVAVCVCSYLFFTFATPCYVGYPLFVLYVLFVWHRRSGWCSYRCGSCGAPLRSAVGRCPHCGAQNE